MKPSSRPMGTSAKEISHLLAKVLRHDAARLGVNIRSDGYCVVEKLMDLPQFQKIECDVLDVARAAGSSETKTRFEMMENTIPCTRALCKGIP